MTDNTKVNSGFNISILVDYAHEPESMKQLLNSTQEWKRKGFFDYVIHIVSCDGAGRDDWKKPILGELSYKLADYSVVTIDNYDLRDKPDQILALLTQKFDPQAQNTKYTVTSNRREAFQLALKQTKEVTQTSNHGKFLIVSTGVGSEQGLTQPKGVVQWDERVVWREEFARFCEA